MNTSQLQAILWAQWRTVLNHTFRHNHLANALTGLFTVVWYGGWAFAAWALAQAAADPVVFRETLAPALPAVLLLICLYWQFVPLVMVSSGISLDLGRLLIYPIPHSHLFMAQALLRITTALEMVLITLGLLLGMLRNGSLPYWAPLILIPFAAFNVLMSAGSRDLLARLLARRGIREVLVFVLVLGTVLPQVLLARQTGSQGSFWNSMKTGWGELWPWTATARIAAGQASPLALLSLSVGVALAWLYARSQFHRALRFDAAEARASRVGGERRPLLDTFYNLPDRILPDPLAALVGKELRFLSRAPRFRLLFGMGFSFGLCIWLPVVMRSGESAPLRTNYLTVVSSYALLLLGEALFWNSLGMDRVAAQTWFVAPVSFTSVLIAKNITAGVFVFLEIGMIALACSVLRFPVTWYGVAETLAVISVLTILLISAGNIMSTRFPRAVDPARSWQGSAGRNKGYLLLVYPLASLPIALAYGARYAFETEWAFWGVIGLDLMVAAVVYGVALDSAVAAADTHREEIISALSGGESPLTG